MNTIKVKSPLNQLITVSVTGCILLFTLVFVIWTYRIDKNENAILLESRIKQVEKITEGLIEVQKIKLDSIANVIVNGPIFKGAISTDHEKTIVDILDNTKNKNDLLFIVVLEGKRILYSDSQTNSKFSNIKEITAGNFISIQNLDSKTIIFGKSLSFEEINQWSEITASKFIVSRNKTKEIITRNDNNYDLDKIENGVEQTIDNQFIIGKQMLLKDTLKIIHFIPTEEIRKAFNRKRNQLFVFGLTLIFVGFILSLLLSKLIINVLKKNSVQSNTDSFDYLIKEIEKLKGILRESK